jgi:cytochrome c-type biogenesis protein CcmE
MELERASNRSLVVLVLLSGVFVALFVSSMNRHHEDEPYLMVDELLEKGLDAYRGDRLRVHGWVVPGSIQRHDGWATFVIQKNKKRLRVRADGPMPDTLCDDREVVVIGVLHRDVLEAGDVIAKCPSKYEGTPGRPCGGSVMLYE